MLSCLNFGRILKGTHTNYFACLTYKTTDLQNTDETPASDGNNSAKKRLKAWPSIVCTTPGWELIVQGSLE